MKRKLLLIVFFSAVFFVQQVSFAQIPSNAGFENWHLGLNGHPEPDDWFPVLGSPNVTIVQAAGMTGNYSVCLLSDTITNGIYYGARMEYYYSGNIRPINLTGYWKGDFSNGTDSLFIGISVWDSSSAFIGNGIVSTFPASSIINWTAFSTGAINYYSANTATATIIQVRLNSTSLNTIGYLDNLVMTYVTDVGEIQTMNLLGSYISSDLENNSLSLNLSTPSSFTLNIFSADGKKVSQKNYSLDAGQHLLALPTENLGQGIYFCRVAGECVNKAFKFVR